MFKDGSRGYYGDCYNFVTIGTPVMLVVKTASIAGGSAFVGNLFNRISKDQVKEAVNVVAKAEDKVEAKRVAEEEDLRY